jgi:GTP:adenosylcobinamide-phosphate guanylyltransferase
MPFVNADLLAVELALLNQTGADLVIPRTPGGLEPFHAVYRRETCLPHVQAALEAGKRRVDAWFANVNVCAIPEESIRRLNPQSLAFLNVNTPEELAAAEKLAASAEERSDRNKTRLVQGVVVHRPNPQHAALRLDAQALGDRPPGFRAIIGFA